MPYADLIRRFGLLAVFMLWLLGASDAQSGQNCPILGLVFSAPADVLNRSAAVPSAARVLQASLEESLSDGTLDAANTSFYLSVFSADESVFQFGYAGTAANGSLDTGNLDENTIFRIGSVSKLFTVYSLLAEVGTAHMNDPVTRWVPELAAAHSGGPVEHVQWDKITIGALAGQMAGIGRDLSLLDLSTVFNDTVAEALGLPTLPLDEIPSCGISNLLPACPRDQFFYDLANHHPITSPFNTPAYSNIAYQILAYALEGITRKPFADVFDSSLRKPLGLSRTYLEPPSHADNVIIPGNQLESWWSVSTGDASPMGGMFSTAADMSALGQSILSSSVLEPSVTRQWLKPISHTADLRVSVGMPWEIHRVDVPTGSTSANSTGSRIVDLYTKNGDLGSYSALLALSPDHQFGYVVLLAGPYTQGAVRNLEMAVIADAVAATMLPAFEGAARQQATIKFEGPYSSMAPDTNTTTTLILTADDGRPGLGVASWRLGDVDLLETYAAVVLGADPRSAVPSLRLYPMGLAGDGEVAFRGVWEILAAGSGSGTESGSGPFTSGCLPWGRMDTPDYGNVAFDDFVFSVDGDGNAVSVAPRVSRVTLSRRYETRE